eukprot:scaffold72557_cov70-Phaeocystis_antarctica.AAC.4
MVRAVAKFHQRVYITANVEDGVLKANMLLTLYNHRTAGHRRTQQQSTPRQSGVAGARGQHCRRYHSPTLEESRARTPFYNSCAVL